jgi:hypothetical protein
MFLWMAATDRVIRPDNTPCQSAWNFFNGGDHTAIITMVVQSMGGLPATGAATAETVSHPYIIVHLASSQPSVEVGSVAMR